MDLGDGSSWLFLPLQILIVDLLLGADNALVIALVCRLLAPEDVRRATTIGVAGAIVFRLGTKSLDRFDAKRLTWILRLSPAASTTSIADAGSTDRLRQMRKKARLVPPATPGVSSTPCHRS